MKPCEILSYQKSLITPGMAPIQFYDCYGHSIDMFNENSEPTQNPIVTVKSWFRTSYDSLSPYRCSSEGTSNKLEDFSKACIKVGIYRKIAGSIFKNIMLGNWINPDNEKPEGEVEIFEWSLNDGEDFSEPYASDPSLIIEHGLTFLDEISCDVPYAIPVVCNIKTETFIKRKLTISLPDKYFPLSVYKSTLKKGCFLGIDRFYKGNSHFWDYMALLEELTDKATMEPHNLSETDIDMMTKLSASFIAGGLYGTSQT